MKLGCCERIEGAKTHLINIMKLHLPVKPKVCGGVVLL